MRRARISTLRTSPLSLTLVPMKVSQTGMTMWFETMVASAIVATITIEVADENPPRKASIANAS